MADSSTSILGSQKKAASDGTETRQKMKGWGTTIFIVIGSIALILFLIFWGYRLFGDDDASPVAVAPPVVVQPAPANDEVPWSRKITVRAGKLSHIIDAPPHGCFDIAFYGVAENADEFLRKNSFILPWRSKRWIPNNGGSFQAILIGCAYEDFSFRYRFLPHCS